MNYGKLNNIIGWIVWAIATYVYVETVEPTASFWDCGEFIATAYKLEVGHPPGAPLFMMIGRLFTIFGGSAENAAYMINLLSALSSSFTILFLFWTITAVGKKLTKYLDGEFDTAKQIAVIGSGIVGALAYTFSDSFWFSAVEGEVYAMSSLFTALVFWAILKWEACADEPGNLRWIVFIAFMMGLSVGVHLLNLLCIPAITFVYYFKKYEPTNRGILITGLVSVGILGFIQYGIVPGTYSLGSIIEKWIVNGFNAPFNSGMLVYTLILTAGIIWTLRYAQKNGKHLLHLATMCITVILIGYSSFAMILIRSSANPPMDENNPEDPFSLVSYLNREQYGDRPLFYGQYFDSPLDPSDPYHDGKKTYSKFTNEDGTREYRVTDDGKSSVPNYDSRFTMLFPRMWSPQGNHKRAYKSWSNMEGKAINFNGQTIKKPTMMENMAYFFRYQINHMYIRYFMWNFAGKQNDIQGHGSPDKGNWMSGIPIFDKGRIGEHTVLPPSMTENEAHNKFYMLPLILGLLGLGFQFFKSKREFAIVGLLFFFTGLAIVIYLNQYPYQPRERDYAYAASFYAFAIWIGLGVLAIYNFGRKYLSGTAMAGLATVVGLTIPAIMGAEGWDDHDRSNRYTARDFAINYLESCAPNAILFTNGDNDTFPLWYAQEVEGIRTDIRVVNLSLLNTDWYIEQMRRAAYDAGPMPGTLPRRKYVQGTNDLIPIYERNKGAVDVVQTMEFILSDDVRSKLNLRGGKESDFIPSKNHKLKFDKNALLKTAADYEKYGLDPKKDTNNIVDVRWRVDKSYIMKNDLMILDLLAANNWERPVYFAITTGDDAYLGLQDHFQLEGLTYRLIPVKTPRSQQNTARVDVERMYDNMMNKFKWGGMEGGKIYMDENNRRMCMNLRNNFARLAGALMDQGDKKRAIEVLDRCMEIMPDEVIPYNYFIVPVARQYFRAGETEKGVQICKDLFDQYEADVKYYASFKGEQGEALKNEKGNAMAIVGMILQVVTYDHPQQELAQSLNERYQKMQAMLSAGMPQGPRPGGQQPQQQPQVVPQGGQQQPQGGQQGGGGAPAN